LGFILKGYYLSGDKKAFVLWFTGLSGSGKSAISDRVFKMLKERGEKVEKLDGDVTREYFPNTGFDRQSRDEHIKRIGFMASRLEHHGITVVASFVSPYIEARGFVRKLCNNFIEVYVATPLEVCEKRDVKGLYKKARAGDIENFTGISDPYETPENPELIIKTQNQTIEESVQKVMNYIDGKYYE
jgi:adenylylsulfate kinase